MHPGVPTKMSSVALAQLLDVSLDRKKQEGQGEGELCIILA